MKLNINRNCDLSSISVLPPHARTSNTASSAAQASQLRSQPSQQQSLSPGFSSQHAYFSQFSQSSLDEGLPTDQRFSSQERENSGKKVASLSRSNISREGNQMQISRSSANQMRKWSASPISENRCQISEELEHRLGMIETSINRFGMILDSVQSDVMQVNKGTKEVLLENGIRQKLIAEDASLQLMNKGIEDIKTNFDGGMKSLLDQQSNNMYLDKLQQIYLLLSNLSTQMETSLFKMKNELQNSLTKEVQAIARSVMTASQNNPVIAAIPPKYADSRATPERKPRLLRNPAMPSKAHNIQSSPPTKAEVGGWNSIKVEKSTFIERPPVKQYKRGEIPCTQSVRQRRLAIESDEEIDEGFSCFLGEKNRDTTISLSQEAQEETDRILRRARRQKRKYNNPIIID